MNSIKTNHSTGTLKDISVPPRPNYNVAGNNRLTIATGLIFNRVAHLFPVPLTGNMKPVGCPDGSEAILNNTVTDTINLRSFIETLLKKNQKALQKLTEVTLSSEDVPKKFWEIMNDNKNAHAKYREFVKATPNRIYEKDCKPFQIKQKAHKALLDYISKDAPTGLHLLCKHYEIISYMQDRLFSERGRDDSQARSRYRSNTFSFEDIHITEKSIASQPTNRGVPEDTPASDTTIPIIDLNSFVETLLKENQQELQLLTKAKLSSKDVPREFLEIMQDNKNAYAQYKDCKLAQIKQKPHRALLDFISKDAPIGLHLLCKMYEHVSYTKIRLRIEKRKTHLINISRVPGGYFSFKDIQITEQSIGGQSPNRGDPEDTPARDIKDANRSQPDINELGS